VGVRWGWLAQSFFFQAEVGERAGHAALADGQATLAEFLGNDGGGYFRVQEAVPDNLPDDFVGAAVMGFRAAALTLEGGGPAGLEAG